MIFLNTLSHVTPYPDVEGQMTPYPDLERQTNKYFQTHDLSPNLALNTKLGYQFF